jgi:cyanophycin synthetase
VKEVREIFEKYAVSDNPVTMEHIRILGGANYFSGGPVVHLRVNLNEFDEVFTNEIPGFFKKLAMTLPTLIEHHCSEGVRGGFFMRVQAGTLLGHVIEHVAIELQTLAGMDVSYGKTRSTIKQGVYNIVFRFSDEYAGLYAAKASVNLINAILTDKEFPLMDVIEQLIFIREKHSLGPTTRAIVEEAEIRKIPWQRLDEYNLIQIGTGIYQKRIRSTLTPQTSMLAVETSQDRALTNMMLADAGLPVPQTFLIESAKNVEDFVRNHPGKYYIRPRFRKTSYSLAVIIDENSVVNEKLASFTIENEQLMVQASISGQIIRLLVIGDQCCAAAKIELPYITGDGIKSVKQLIAELNKEPGRLTGDKGVLSYVTADEETDLVLRSINLTYDSVPEKERKIKLKISPNPNNGSHSENVTSIIHHDYRALAVKAIHITGLDVGTVNIITEDITESPYMTNAFITEIYAAPNFRMYIKPASGNPEPVVPLFVDHVLRLNDKFHIPLFSITGSFGKTTLTRIIYKGLCIMGFKTGLSNSDGLFLSGMKIKEAEVIDPHFVHLILKDPHTEAAVLETPVESIMNYGLGYNLADYGVVLNVHEKHLNEIDIRRIDDLAYVKSVVAEEVREDGYAILNADEPLIQEMQKRVTSKIAWFSKNPDNPFTKKLISSNATLAISQKSNIVIYKNGLMSNNITFDQNPEITNTEGEFFESVVAAVLLLDLIGFDLNKTDQLFEG